MPLPNANEYRPSSPTTGFPLIADYEPPGDATVGDHDGDTTIAELGPGDNLIKSRCRH